MVLIETGTELSRCPVGGRQGVQVVPGGHCRQPGEDVTEVDQRVDLAPLAGDDDRVDDGGTLAGVGMPDKQPVFLFMLSSA